MLHAMIPCCQSSTRGDIMTQQTDLTTRLHAAFDLADRQVRHLIETYPNYFPMYTQNGKWKHGGEAWTNWCEGFLGGQMWLLHRHSGDSYWRAKAEHYSHL